MTTDPLREALLAIGAEEWIDGEDATVGIPGTLDGVTERLRAALAPTDKPMHERSGINDLHPGWTLTLAAGSGLREAAKAVVEADDEHPIPEGWLMHTCIAALRTALTAPAQPLDVTPCDCRHTAHDHTDRGIEDAGLCLYPDCTCPEFVETEYAAEPAGGEEK